jgi:Flp pilus assembly pilin Flp
VEYAVMTLIAVAIVAVVSQVGTSVTALYEKVERIFN